MYNQSEPRTEPPEDMDDYREAQSGILAANQKMRMLDEQEAMLSNIRAQKKMWDMEETRNAIITSATITSDDHGVLSAWLQLDYGGMGQGFGGYCLYLPKSFTHHELKSYAGHFIWRVMEIAGVSEWRELSGKTIRVKCTNSNVSAIGHIVNDDWFNPSKDFSE